MNISQNSVIILNPISGGGNKEDRLSAIKKASLDLGFMGKIILTTKNTSAHALAKREIKKGIKRIIVCGGDGTILEVAGTLVNQKISLGIVPLGTGNLFARNLGIPLSIPESLEIALKNKTSKIDLGRANGTYFAVIAGMGVDAHIMKKSEGDLKKKIGYLAYVVSAARSLSYKNKTYKISVDNNKPKVYHAKSVLIANMDKIQGGLQIVPHAHPKSGSLKVGIIKAQNVGHFLDLFMNSATRKVHESKHYELLTCKSAVIEVLDGKSLYECDGTVFKQVRKLEVEVYPQSLIVAIP